MIFVMLVLKDPLSLNNGTIPTTDLFKGSAVVSCSAVSKYKVCCEDVQSIVDYCYM